MAIEDFTTYTEVDASSRLTVTASKARGVNVDRDIDVYLHFDKGVDNYDAIDIDFETQIESASANGSRGGMGLTVSAISVIDGFGSTDIAVMFRRLSSGFKFELNRGDAVATDLSAALSSGTTYYCTLLRTAGSNTVTLDIYSNSARTTLVETLSVSGYGGSTKYRRLYGFVNKNTGSGGNDWDGFIQNMEDFSSNAFTLFPPVLALTATLSSPTGIDTSKPPALAASLSLPLAVSILTAKPAALSAALSAYIPVAVITFVTRLQARLRDIRLIAVKRDTGLIAGHRDTQIIVRSKRT